MTRRGGSVAHSAIEQNRRDLHEGYRESLRHRRICENLGLDPKKVTAEDIDKMRFWLRPTDRVQRCALCGAFYPKFPENVDRVNCKRCGVEWIRG